MTQALTRDESLAVAARSLLPAGEHTEPLIAMLSGPGGPISIEVFHFVDILSRIAVIVLLFLVGLETSVSEMGKVGKASLRVAVIGIAAPFLLGVGVMSVLDSDSALQKALFVGVVLVATSVGITARIFRDMQKANRPEARTILGAAVFDDVPGMLFLAVLTGFIATGAVDLRTVAIISLKAIVFLSGSILAGMWFTPALIRKLAHLNIANLKLLLGVGVAFVFSWLADRVGLAPIVGGLLPGWYWKFF